MQETCKCGQNKVTTEVDGRFVYQVCDVCGSVLNVTYMGPKINLATFRNELIEL